jgi:ATP-dependent DNA helicase RecQ
VERRHDQLSVYGIGKEKPKEYWNSILRQLLNLNYIAIKNWEYRNLALTSKAQEILTGKIKLELRQQSEKIAKVKTAAKIDKKRISNNFEGELYDELKDLRNRLAKEKNLPAYIVFNDKTLQDMCSIKPRNHSEFLLVHGVGQNKLENYGDVFLDVIKKHLD